MQGYQGKTIDREALALVPTPLATDTHRPIPHHEIVTALVETLGFRHIGVVRDEYAVSPDGMKMFGVLDLETEMHGCRFSIGVTHFVAIAWRGQLNLVVSQNGLQPASAGTSGRWAFSVN